MIIAPSPVADPDELAISHSFGREYCVKPQKIG